MHKNLGIVGGSGPEATMLLVNKQYQLARAQGHNRLEEYPRMTVAYTPLLQDVNTDAELEQVITELLNAADRLIQAGATHICYPCNTHHLSFDAIRQRVGGKAILISMVELACQEIKAKGYKRVAVIGTGYSMSQGLYSTRLNELGVEIVELGKEVEDKSHAIIGDALSGIRTEMTDQYVQFVNQISDNHEFDAIVLGCTEYSVLEDQRTESQVLNAQVVDPLMLLASELNRVFYES